MARNAAHGVMRREHLSAAMGLLPRISIPLFGGSFSLAYSDAAPNTALECAARLRHNDAFPSEQQSATSEAPTPGCHHREGAFSNSQVLGAPAAMASEGATSDLAAEKGERSKPKTGARRSLIEVLRILPNWGVGARVAKSHWQAGNYYEITVVKPKGGKTGTVLGIYHNRGEPDTGKEDKVGGVAKKGWREVKPEESADAWKRA